MSLCLCFWMTTLQARTDGKWSSYSVEVDMNDRETLPSAANHLRAWTYDVSKRRSGNGVLTLPYHWRLPSVCGICLGEWLLTAGRRRRHLNLSQRSHAVWRILCAISDSIGRFIIFSGARENRGWKALAWKSSLGMTGSVSRPKKITANDVELFCCVGT